MAYVKTWSTKEEVLKDLARASGRRIRKKDDLDEGYLVIGDAPPPIIPEDEDAEMQILFGQAASRKAVETEEDATPDLAGIQQMLRMMQEFNSGNDDDTRDATAGKDCVIAITKVSKLNPNVEEFKPNGVNSPRASSYSINKDINSNVVAQTVDDIEVSSIKATEVTTENKENQKVHVDEHFKENNVQDIATTLKKQISDGAKSDIFEVKKQKNVAIATLLRLYANNNTSPIKSTAPLKLCTPEYFVSKIENHPNVVKVEAPLDIVSSSPSPTPKDSSMTLPSCSTTPNETSSPKKKIDPEIKKSIEKVNRWLEEPTKRNSPAVCLGPIAFKRKEPINCKSPVSNTAPKTSKPDDSKQYQPTKYAKELGRQYLERSKAMESKKKEITWVNLEEKLKEKDYIIKKRLEKQASTTDS